MRFLTSLATFLLLALCTFAADPPVIKSVKSGPWSAPTTWEGNAVPGADARVLIREGHSITYDTKSDVVIRGITVSGTLQFAPDKDTVLNVGLIKIQAGNTYSEEGFDCDHGAEMPSVTRPALLVGTPETPIGKTATIRLHFVEGMNKETCPAIVCCGGRMDFHGQPLSHARGRSRAHDVPQAFGRLTGVCRVPAPRQTECARQVCDPLPPLPRYHAREFRDWLFGLG